MRPAPEAFYFIEEHEEDEIYKFLDVDIHPEQCPICHHAIYPKLILGYENQLDRKILFQCPRKDCLELFIAYYEPTSPKTFALLKCEPHNPVEQNFHEEIEQISPNFVEIYGQASQAEQMGLDLICGVAYRKSLEFLIKDYLVDKFPEREEEFLAKFLGNCIKLDITNPDIKDMAERATWLGNDETHYVKKWEEKDINDLKKLIDITVQWIVLELRTKKYKSEMANGKK